MVASVEGLREVFNMKHNFTFEDGASNKRNSAVLSDLPINDFFLMKGVLHVKTSSSGSRRLPNFNNMIAVLRTAEVEKVTVSICYEKV